MLLELALSGHAQLLTYMEPTIQKTEAIWMLVRREYLSAMKDDARAPTRDPNGIEAVMPPWR